MRLHRIRLRHVLSFEEASFTCDHHVTALVGPNDAGKTNILRILHHLAGQTPSLDMAELRSQFFPEQEPIVDLSFVTEVNDRGPLVDILGWQQLPEPPFKISLSCRSQSVVLQAANESPRNLAQEAGEQMLGRLLHTVYVQPELRPMRTSIPFSDIIDGVSSPEARLFSMAGLNKGHLNSIFRGAERGDDARRDAARVLNEEFQKVWKQEKSKIQLYARLNRNIRDCTLDIKVEDPAEHVCVSLEHRGAGLRWFLALLVQLRETPRRENTLCNLFLIDEPGVFLHPLGQADLYSLLSDLSEKPTNQVIYATHSPFMLDWSRPHEIRVVERRRDGTIPASIIVDKAYHENKALLFWEPFRRSLGLFIGDFGLLGEKNLLVEGPTDQIIFSYLGRVTRQLSDWKIIPCNDTEVCVFIARICKQIGREVAVLVDSDEGGDAYLGALIEAKCADIPIHNLHEFCLRPIDRRPFCLEEFLSLKQYVAAVNEAYDEMDWYSNSPISEAEINALEPTTSIGRRLEELFEKRTWKDNQPHTFAKAFVSIHLASSRRAFDVQNFDGNFGAISERLSNPYGLIKLGIESSPGQGHHWSALFSLALDPVKRGVGVMRIMVHADAASGRKGERVFPPTDVTKGASVPPVSTGSAETSSKDIQNPGNDPPAEDPANDGITVFDCWQREWVPNTSTSFLTQCAGIVKIQGSEAFERTKISFIIAYCDGTTDKFEIPFSYDGKRPKNGKRRDRFTGTVKWFDPERGYGFIEPSSGGRDVFVHISALEEVGLDTLDEGDTIEYELVTAYDGRTSAGNLKQA